MILSKWLATLLGGAFAVQGALAIELNIDDESTLPTPPVDRIRWLIQCFS